MSALFSLTSFLERLYIGSFGKITLSMDLPHCQGILKAHGNRKLAPAGGRRKLINRISWDSVYSSWWRCGRWCSVQRSVWRTEACNNIWMFPEGKLCDLNGNKRVARPTKDWKLLFILMGDIQSYTKYTKIASEVNLKVFFFFNICIPDCYVACSLVPRRSPLHKCIMHVFEFNLNLPWCKTCPDKVVSGKLQYNEWCNIFRYCHRKHISDL